MVQLRDDVVGIDSAIIGSPKVWEASGHLAGFSDPMVDCKESNQRFRADQVLYSAVLDAEGKQCGYVSCQQDEVSNEKALAKKAKKLVKEAGGKGPHQPLNFKELIDCPVELIDQIPSPATGNPGTLTPPRDFNLMFSTNVGPVVADSSTAFLRPETAQGIFTNFKNVMDTSRVSLPFGIAQIGKAFRNEITPRNFIFRSREFEQMEIEYFIKEDDWERCHQVWPLPCAPPTSTHLCHTCLCALGTHPWVDNTSWWTALFNKAGLPEVSTAHVQADLLVVVSGAYTGFPPWSHSNPQTNHTHRHTHPWQNDTTGVLKVQERKFCEYTRPEECLCPKNICAALGGCGGCGEECRVAQASRGLRRVVEDCGGLWKVVQYCRRLFSVVEGERRVRMSETWLWRVGCERSLGVERGFCIDNRTGLLSDRDGPQ